MPDYHLTPNSIGFTIGTDLPAHQITNNKASVVIKTAYDAGFKITKSKISIEIPLDINISSIISPKDTQGEWYEISSGEIGLAANTNIFDNTADTGDQRIENYVAIHDDNTGYLHVKIPIVIALKKDHVNFMTQNL